MVVGVAMSGRGSTAVGILLCLFSVVVYAVGVVWPGSLATLRIDPGPLGRDSGRLNE
ncbi:hypothetical protein ACWFRJ_06045 [Streptomyces sp. NPDC055239]